MLIRRIGGCDVSFEGRFSEVIFVATGRTLLVLIVAAATLLVGLLEAAPVDAPREGIGRSLSCDLGAAALEKSVDAEADDDDGSHERSWHGLSPTDEVPARACISRIMHAHADAVPWRPLLATSSVRGPPACP